MDPIDTTLIDDEISRDLERLPPALARWVHSHLVAPSPIVLSTDPDGRIMRTFWLVTDHIGSDDAPCRVVFDGVAFGLAITVDSGVEWYVGPIGSFAKAVQNL
jgi:hypothetical protein